MGEIINWMGGWPQEGLLSAKEWQERRHTERNTQRKRKVPAITEDDEELRGWLTRGRLMGSASSFKSNGNEASRKEEAFYFVQGADAALQVAIRGILRPGDVVLTERITSRLALQAIRRIGASPLAVEGDEEGMDPDALAVALNAIRPGMVYVSATCTDPEGRSWSKERRTALLSACEKAGVPLLLDGRQDLMVDEGEDRWDWAASGEGIVLSVGELPPGLIGGLRLGWLTVSGKLPHDHPGRLFDTAGADIDEGFRLPEEDRLALTDYWREHSPEQALATLRFVCQSRRELLVELLDQQHIAGLSCPRAEDTKGLHTWVTLPDGLDAEALLRASWLQGVLFQPGAGFYVSEPDRYKIRITAVHSDDREIRAGVSRLSQAVGDFIGRSV